MIREANTAMPISVIHLNDQTGKVEIPLPEEQGRPAPDELAGMPCHGHFWRPGL